MLYSQSFLDSLEAELANILWRWNIQSDAELKLLAISENATYQVLQKTGKNIVLRVHRPAYHTYHEITSELSWIDALHQSKIVKTPKIISQIDGSLVATLSHQGQQRYVVAFEFIPGVSPDENADLVPAFYTLGQITARLHQHSRQWTRPPGFCRKVWNFQSTLGSQPLWGDFRDALGLTPEGRKLLELTALRLENLLTPWEKPDYFGLIHADLRLANLLIDGEDLAVIDFDDCGISWYLYDFAAAVSFIEHQPYIPDLMDSWIRGYSSVAPLDQQEVTLLPVLVMLRRILLTAWIASHAETPTAQALGVGYTEGTLNLAERFLSQYS